MSKSQATAAGGGHDEISKDQRETPLFTLLRLCGELLYDLHLRTDRRNELTPGFRNVYAYQLEIPLISSRNMMLSWILQSLDTVSKVHIKAGRTVHSEFVS